MLVFFLLLNVEGGGVRTLKAHGTKYCAAQQMISHSSASAHCLMNASLHTSASKNSIRRFVITLTSYTVIISTATKRSSFFSGKFALY